MVMSFVFAGTFLIKASNVYVNARTQVYGLRCSNSTVFASNQNRIESSLQGTTPTRVTSGGIHTRGLAPGQHSSEETSLRWRAVGDTASQRNACSLFSIGVSWSSVQCVCMCVCVCVCVCVPNRTKQIA